MQGLRINIAVLALSFGLMIETTLGHPDFSATIPYFYVAPGGSDANPGTLDSPFATLDRARDAVRSLKKEAAAIPPGPIVVAVRGGTYFLKRTFVLCPEDSGTAVQPIFYTAYQQEKPIFSGGRRITHFSNIEGMWTTTLPEVSSGTWSFTRLFVNGNTRSRPRLPKKGFYYFTDQLEPTPENMKKGFDRVAFKPGDLRPDWQNLGDVEVIGFHIWAASRMRLATVDAGTSIATFTGVTPSTADWTKWPRGGRYLVDNVKEALSEPGQWYLDRKSGVLSYIPLPGEDLGTVEMIAPYLDRLVELHGDLANKKWVHDITLRGLHFRHANWVTPPRGQSTIQAESNLSAAIYAVGARDCTLEASSISQIGEYAIWLAAGCKRILIDHCEMTDLGGGGVKIGEIKAFDDDDSVASDNIVRECLIAHGGRLHPAAIGVWIGHSPYNKILHNDIVDFYYTGISPGWSWGYGRSLSHHNEIAHNHIRQIGQGVLSDMGGIYTLGAGEGNHLHHNLIHDIDSYDYGGWGIYFDEGSSKAIAENNVVHHTKSAGFHQHYGKDNTVRNNVFAFGREAQLMRTRPELDHLTLSIHHNIVLYKEAQLLGLNWEGDNYRFDSNLYWRTDREPVTFANQQTLQQWQARGQDTNSLVADPLFVNAACNDYHLQSDSPAHKLGIESIDVSTAGRSCAMPETGTGTMLRAFPEWEAPPTLLSSKK